MRLKVLPPWLMPVETAEVGTSAVERRESIMEKLPDRQAAEALRMRLEKLSSGKSLVVTIYSVVLKQLIRTKLIKLPPMLKA